MLAAFIFVPVCRWFLCVAVLPPACCGCVYHNFTGLFYFSRSAILTFFVYAIPIVVVLRSSKLPILRAATHCYAFLRAPTYLPRTFYYRTVVTHRTLRAPRSGPVRRLASAAIYIAMLLTALFCGSIFTFRFTF